MTPAMRSYVAKEIETRYPKKFNAEDLTDFEIDVPGDGTFKINHNAVPKFYKEITGDHLRFKAGETPLVFDPQAKTVTGMIGESFPAEKTSWKTVSGKTVKGHILPDRPEFMGCPVGYVDGQFYDAQSGYSMFNRTAESLDDAADKAAEILAKNKESKGVDFQQVAGEKPVINKAIKPPKPKISERVPLPENGIVPDYKPTPRTKPTPKSLNGGRARESGVAPKKYYVTDAKNPSFGRGQWSDTIPSELKPGKVVFDAQGNVVKGELKPSPKPTPTQEVPKAAAPKVESPKVDAPATETFRLVNMESLSRGTGAKYIVGIRGGNGDLIAKRWARSADAKLAQGEVIVDFNGKTILNDANVPVVAVKTAPAPTKPPTPPQSAPKPERSVIYEAKQGDDELFSLLQKKHGYSTADTQTIADALVKQKRIKRLSSEDMRWVSSDGKPITKQELDEILVKSAPKTIDLGELFHGTTAGNAIREYGFQKKWTHLTDSKEIADSYQGWVRGDSPDTLKVSFSPKNPKYFDAGGMKYTDHKENLAYKINKAAGEAEKAGHDALVITNIRDHYDSSVKTAPHTSVIVFDPTEITLVSSRSVPKPTEPVRAPQVKEPWQMTREERSNKYPTAKGTVDGRIVREDIPNMGSIASSLDDYVELPGIREVPMSDFTGLTGRHYSVKGTERIRALAEQIKSSGELNPLIVVLDKEGAYVLEGGTRIEALYSLGAKSIPAKVVIDKGDIAEAVKQALKDGKPVPAQVLADYPDLAAKYGKGAPNPVYEPGKKYYQDIPEVTRISPQRLLNGSDGTEVSRVSDAVARSMKFDEPIEATIFKGGDVIVSDGHHRRAAARQLGLDWVPVKLKSVNATGETIQELVNESVKFESKPFTHKPEPRGARAAETAYETLQDIEAKAKPVETPKAGIAPEPWKLTKAEWEANQKRFSEEAGKAADAAAESAGIKWTTNYSKMESELRKKISKLEDAFFKTNGMGVAPIKKELDAAKKKLAEVLDGKAQADTAHKARFDAERQAVKDYYADKEDYHSTSVWEDYILSQRKAGKDIPLSALEGSRFEGGFEKQLLPKAKAMELARKIYEGSDDVNIFNELYQHNSLAHALGKDELVLRRKDFSTLFAPSPKPVQVPKAAIAPEPKPKVEVAQFHEAANRPPTENVGNRLLDEIGGFSWKTETIKKGSKNIRYEVLIDNESGVELSRGGTRQNAISGALGKIFGVGKIPSYATKADLKAAVSVAKTRLESARARYIELVEGKTGGTKVPPTPQPSPKPVQVPKEAIAPEPTNPVVAQFHESANRPPTAAEIKYYRNGKFDKNGMTPAMRSYVANKIEAEYPTAWKAMMDRQPDSPVKRFVIDVPGDGTFTLNPEAVPGFYREITGDQLKFNGFKDVPMAFDPKSKLPGQVNSDPAYVASVKPPKMERVPLPENGDVPAYKSVPRTKPTPKPLNGGRARESGTAPKKYYVTDAKNPSFGRGEWSDTIPSDLKPGKVVFDAQGNVVKGELKKPSLKESNASSARKTLDIEPFYGTGRKEYKLTEDGHVIQGQIDGIPLVTHDVGVVPKLSNQTKKAIEDAFSDPTMRQIIDDAGVKYIQVRPHKTRDSIHSWTMGMTRDGGLLVHYKSAEAIAKSTAERAARGFNGVIAHEAGHGYWNRATQAQKDAFGEALRPFAKELEDEIGKIVNLKPGANSFDYDPKGTKLSEIHAELQAMRYYNPERYKKLPDGVKTALEAIQSTKKPEYPKWNIKESNAARIAELEAKPKSRGIKGKQTGGVNIHPEDIELAARKALHLVYTAGEHLHTQIIKIGKELGLSPKQRAQALEMAKGFDPELGKFHFEPKPKQVKTPKNLPVGEKTLKHADTAPVRESLGMPEYTKTAETIDDTFRVARERGLVKDARKIAASVIENPKRPVNKYEQAALIARADELDVLSAQKYEQLGNTPEGKRQSVLDQIAAIEDEYSTIIKASDLTGSAQGSALRLRREASKELTSANIKGHIIKANGGTLPHELEARIGALSEKLAKANQAVRNAKKAVGRGDAQAALNTAAKAEKSGKKAARGTRNRLFTKEAFEEVMARRGKGSSIPKSKQRGAAMIDAQDWKDLGTIVGYHIESGIRDFPQLMSKSKEVFPDVDDFEVSKAVEDYYSLKKLTPEAKAKAKAASAATKALKADAAAASAAGIPDLNKFLYVKISAGKRDYNQLKEAAKKAGFTDLNDQEFSKSIIDVLRERGHEFETAAEAAARRQKYSAVSEARALIEKTRVKAAYEETKGLKRAGYVMGQFIMSAPGQFKNLRASFDLSAAGRQGLLLSIAHPKKGAQALKSMLESVTKQGYEKVIADVHASKYFEAGQIGGLGIADTKGHMTTDELFTHLPFETKFGESPLGQGIKKYGGAIPRMSEQTYNAYLSHLRQNVFDSIAAGYEAQGGKLTKANAEQIAQYVNSMSGLAKSKNQALEGGLKFLNWFLFSSRFLTSRAQVGSGYTLGRALVHGGPLAKQAAKDHAIIIGGLSTILGLTTLAGGKVSANPDNPDFLQVQFGNQRVDITGGVAPVLRAMIRGTMGIVKPSVAYATGQPYTPPGYGQDAGTHLGRFFINRTSPLIRAGVNSYQGESFGRPTDPSIEARNLLMPIGAEQAINSATVDKRSISDTFTLAILEFFGLSTQFTDKSPGELERKAEQKAEKAAKKAAEKEEKKSTPTAIDTAYLLGK